MDAPNSPFRLTQFVWESQPGRYVLTAVVHGTARLSQGQEASLVPADYPTGYDEVQALIARLNLMAPFKPRADICVVGKAYAPPGSEADRLVARVRVGDFSKALSITGDRLWIRDGGRWGSSPPRPFAQMLLTSERAIRSAENPIGLDPAAIPVEGRLAMPNLEPVSGSFSAVIGPVPSAAPSRRNLLSPAAVSWVTALELGRPPGPPPEGMNFQFFNVAPHDQQVLELSPGAAIVLENLHPGHAIFTSRLPGLQPRVTGFDPASRRTLEFMLRFDTLWIDGDREIAWIVYRGSVDIARPDLPIQLHVEAERWQRPAEAGPPSLGTATMIQTHAGATPALPFGGARPSPTYPGFSPEATGGYYAGGPPGRAIQNESTNRLEDTGSYPPPPPPKRSITQEIVVPEAPRPAGLPFGGQEAWDAETTSNLPRHEAGLPRQETTEMAALPRQDTAVLSVVGGAPPRKPNTEPPPPPSITAALPFGARAMEPSPESRTATAQAVPAARLVPHGSPGEIPDIGPTLQPVLPDSLIVDEISETTQTDDGAGASPFVVPFVGAPPRAPAPAPVAAPPPVAEPAPRPPSVVPPALPATAPVLPPVAPPAPVAPPPPLAPSGPPAPLSPAPAPPASPFHGALAPQAPPPPAPPPSALAGVALTAPVVAAPLAPPEPVRPASQAPEVPSSWASLSAVKAPVAAPPPAVPPSAVPLAPVSVPAHGPSALGASGPSALGPPTLGASGPPSALGASAPSALGPSAFAIPAAPAPASEPTELAPAPATEPPPAPASPAPEAPDPTPPPPEALSPAVPVAPPLLSSLLTPARKTVPPPASVPPASAPPPTVPPSAPPPVTDDPTPPADEPGMPPEPPPPPPPPPRDLSFDECAAIRGELTVKGADKGDVLARHAVSEADFVRCERDHLRSLDEGTRGGDSSLLERYDDAYLAAQDAARGVVDELAYARIQFARERGQLPQVLDDLRVVRNDLMRLDRVWRRRLAADRELAERVEDELERLRTEG